MSPVRLLLVALTCTVIACSSDDETVLVSVSPGPGNSGLGSVMASDVILCQFDGPATNGVCSATLDQGSGSLDLTALPSEGSAFVGWLGDCSGSTTCTLSLSHNHAVQAAFMLKNLLTVTNDPRSTGIVVVTSSPAGIDCTLHTIFSAGPGSCEAEFPAGTSVTLTATPDEYSGFDNWSGDCTGNTCTLTLGGPAAISARSHGSFPLSIEIPASNAGSGAITSSPGGIDCTVVAAVTSGTCTAMFPGATVVTLLATPASGSVFTYWVGAEDDLGGCTTDPACPVTMTGPRSTPANFAVAPNSRQSNF